jgi:hypothetical protein
LSLIHGVFIRNSKESGTHQNMAYLFEALDASSGFEELSERAALDTVKTPGAQNMSVF